MSDDDKLHKARLDGSRAQSLLNDDLLKSAFTELRRAYADKLLATSVDQTQARETLYQAHRLVGEVMNHLQIVLNDGKLAEHELNSLIRAQEAKTGFR